MPALPEGYNPATWMLEVSGGAAKMKVAATASQDFPALYCASAQCKATAARVQELVTRGAATSAPLSLASRYAVPFAQQTKMVTWKMFILYWCGAALAACATGGLATAVSLMDREILIFWV